MNNGASCPCSGYGIAIDFGGDGLCKRLIPVDSCAEIIRIREKHAARQ